MTEIKVAYVHGRPHSHPMQMKCAEIINADFYPVDFKIRWHDKPDANKFLKYFSWLVCSLTFPNVKKYDVFLAGGLHVTLPLMRFFKQIRKDQKIIVHLGDHSLYFLYSNKYTGKVRKLLLWSLSKYDAIIVEGKMGARFAIHLLGDKTPPVFCVTSGIPQNHFEANLNRKPNFSSNKLLFMGQGPNSNRMYYKGLDVIIEVFKKIYKKNNGLELIIVGEWDTNVIDSLLKGSDEQVKSKIHFKGQVNDLGPFMEESFLYLHCARGEAFGVTVLISMLAGMIPLVSDLTGAQEVVEKLDSRLVVPLEIDEIVEKINWVYSLSENEKLELSKNARKLASDYSEDKVIQHYRDTFFEAYNKVKNI